MKAIVDTMYKEFGNVKIAFDILCVALALLLSLLFFDFTVVGENFDSEKGSIGVYG